MIERAVPGCLASRHPLIPDDVICNTAVKRVLTAAVALRHGALCNVSHGSCPPHVGLHSRRCRAVRDERGVLYLAVVDAPSGQRSARRASRT
jgi:hypothetical protein